MYATSMCVYAMHMHTAGVRKGTYKKKMLCIIIYFILHIIFKVRITSHLHVQKGTWTYPHEFIKARYKNLIDGPGRRWPDVLFYICPVNKSKIYGSSYVRGGQNQTVGEPKLTKSKLLFPQKDESRKSHQSRKNCRHTHTHNLTYTHTHTEYKMFICMSCEAIVGLPNADRIKTFKNFFSIQCLLVKNAYLFLIFAQSWPMNHCKCMNIKNKLSNWYDLFLLAQCMNYSAWGKAWTVSKMFMQSSHMNSDDWIIICKHKIHDKRSLSTPSIKSSFFFC